jgi:phosphatidylserine decarboxylase
MDPQITSIQPGGGWCMSAELAWGSWRRFYLRTFRRGYVERMRSCRQGEPQGVPHEVLDPRDLKFYCNQTDCHWKPADDPFVWRGHLGVARVGLAELILISGSFLLLAAVSAWAALSLWYFWPVAITCATLGLFVVTFFRNPRRVAPVGEGIYVAPADGKVVTIERLEHDEFIGGPAVVIGIFLSVFNVHINRVPVAARVVGLTYHRGKFMNALFADSVKYNEQMHVRLQETGPQGRRMVIKQIAGAIARRIVCWVRPGDELDCGEQFGMIKLGSRTELIIPDEPGLKVAVEIGETVRAGASVMARYATRSVEHGGG